MRTINCIFCSQSDALTIWISPEPLVTNRAKEGLWVREWRLVAYNILYVDFRFSSFFTDIFHSNK